MKEKWTITVRNPLFWLYAVVRSFIRKERCTHEEWDMDNQIRTIRCRSCGKKAWVKEYKNLYQSGSLSLDELEKSLDEALAK